jgi:hypothetical protein
LKDSKALEEYVHKHIFPKVSASQREYLAKFFTEIFSDGFESGDFSAWTALEGAPEVVTDYAHHGSYSCKINAQEGPYKDLGANYSILYVRVYVYFTTLPQYDYYRAGIIKISNAANWNTGIFAEAYRYNDVTTFTIYNAVLDARVDSNVTVETGKWYCVEVKFSSVDGVDCELWIDGTEKATVAYFWYGDADRVSVGYGSALSGGAVQYIDCVVVSDTYIGPEVPHGMSSIVGTSTDANSYPDAPARKAFYSNGLFWVFYTDGTNMGFRTSPNGLAPWSAFTAVRACIVEWRFSIFFDGTYVHYAVGTGTAGDPTYYRKGTPNSDGTITWSAAEQSVGNAETNITNASPMICVDSNGYPWIAYRHHNVGAAIRLAYITKSSTKDGTWTTAAGFPYQLSTTNYPGLVVSAVPLTGGKVLAIWTCRGLPVMSRPWNGSAWGDYAQGTSAIQAESAVSAVNEGDDVDLAFLKQTTYDLVFAKYSYLSNSWGAETIIQPATTDKSWPQLSIDAVKNNLYLWWMGSPAANHIYYKRRTGNSWDTNPTDWVDESADGLGANNKHYCFYKAYSGYIGLTYRTLLASPYNVKFAFLTMTPPSKPKGTITLHAKQLGVT